MFVPLFDYINQGLYVHGFSSTSLLQNNNNNCNCKQYLRKLEAQGLHH